MGQAGGELVVARPVESDAVAGRPMALTKGGDDRDVCCFVDACCAALLRVPVPRRTRRPHRRRLRTFTITMPHPS